MPQNIFKIYDGRNNFSQWDIKQKLIVLDDRVSEVRFYSKDMNNSIRNIVYTDAYGVNVCDVPDLLLQIPKNIIVDACARNSDGSCGVIGKVVYGVRKAARPIDYTYEENSLLEDILTKIEQLEVPDVDNKIDHAINSLNIDNYAKIEDLSDIAFNSVSDRTTSDKYTLYIDNGKLTMEVV